ncbi:MAG TPA: hypothetical protein VFC00_12330 [Micromonosporaceae bacterium]|nr:hypothetical protein [Micromonosporaceae bacterium]
MRRWLRLDALNRAWRTVLQGIAVAVLAAAGDAAIQVVQRALVDAAVGQPMDWTQVRTTAAYAAGTAALMAIAAYLHRKKLDPSPIPSAQPPAPPALRPAEAASAAMQPTTPR